MHFKSCNVAAADAGVEYLNFYLQNTMRPDREGKVKLQTLKSKVSTYIKSIFAHIDDEELQQSKTVRPLGGLLACLLTCLPICWLHLPQSTNHSSVKSVARMRLSTARDNRRRHKTHPGDR